MGLFANRRLPSRSARLRSASATAVEMLESRTLLTATLTNAIGTVSVDPNSAPTMIDLSQHFAAGSLVGVSTDQGSFDIALFDQQTPQTVANFLKYVTGGLYNGTIFHRSIDTPTPFVLQGGGYTPSGAHIATPFPSPVNEPGIHNTVGTVAMAKLSGNPNSATSEWFVNLGDNSSNLDAQNGGFTVFGQVIGNGMQVVNAIAALPTVDDSAQNGAWTDLPTHGYAGPNPATAVPAADMVNIPTMTQLANALTFTTTSDNAALVSPSISGSGLTLTYGPGIGTAHITVAATDSTGASASTTFAVTVGGVSVPLGAGGAKMLRFTDADGTLTTVMLNGPGTAAVQVGGTGATASTVHGRTTVAGTGLHITAITTTGTTGASTLTITGHGGNNVVEVTSISSDAALKSVNAKNTAISQNATFAGTLGSLTLGSASGGTITVSGAATPVALNIGSGTNESISSAAPIKSLTAGSWGAGGTIAAPSVGKVNVKNSFAPDLNTGALTGVTAASITGGTWTITGNAASIAARTITGWAGNFGTLGKLAVSGALDSSVVRSTGDVTSVSAGTLSNSTVFAGVGSASGALPLVPSNYTSASTIRSVKVGRGGYINSDIAANTLGSLNLSNIQVANNGMQFGVAGHVIQNLTGTAGGKRVKLKNLMGTGVPPFTPETGAIASQGVTPQDFLVATV